MVPYEDYLAVSRLDASYWAIADQRSPLAVESLFVASGQLRLGSLDLRGHDAIAQFFAQRRQQNAASGRTTRHVASGCLLDELEDGRLAAQSIVAVFAGSGTPPLASDVPSTIADVEDVFVRNDAGQWLFERRVIRPVFVGASAASFAR